MGHFPISAEKCDNYGGIIDQTTDAGLEKIIFIIFIFLNCSVLVSSGIHQSRVAISKMFFIKVRTIMTLVQIVEACQNLSQYIALQQTDKFSALLQNSQLTCNFDTNCWSV